jgi:TonB family protein
MAYSPVPGPDFPPEPTAPVLPLLKGPGSRETVAPPDAETIFSALRGLIAAAPREPNMILNAIARAAQSITRSSGAAIAVRRNGVVVCLGRSGETAPALETRIDINSGISGECLRIGKVLRCDDTSRDYRADPEVCRRLGLRSIAAVPLRERNETVGILEAFSTQPHAFAEEQMDSLMRLAALAEAAATEWDLENAGALVSDVQTQPAGAEILSQLRHAIVPSSRHSPQLERMQRYRLACVALAMLLLLAVVGWRVRRHSANVTASSQQLATASNTPASANTEAPNVASGPVLVSKPGPGHLSNQTNRPAISRTAQTDATAADVPDSVSRSQNVSDERDHSVMPALSTAEAPAAARIAAATAGADELRHLLSAPATVPSLGRVSHGFSGGVLVHKVQPLYPLQARLLRLAGTVVLQTTIVEDGTVGDLKVINGHPILAEAAIAAVSHWRYRPFLLNGEPIQKQVDISVEFKLPH